MISTESIDNKKGSKFKGVDFHTQFWSSFHMNLKSLKKVIIVMCVLHILGLPLFMLSYILWESINSDSAAGFIPLSIICLAGALLMGFIIALNSFDYLYKKSKVDMVYSLPLNTKQRFFSYYLSGLCAYIVPYIVSVLLTICVHGISLLGIKKWEQECKYMDISILATILKVSFAGLLIIVMFYTLTVLVTSCCGSMFEAIAYNILVNGLIPGVIAVLFFVFYGDLYGVTYTDYILKYISNTSPLGACIGIGNIVILDNNARLIRWYLLTIIVDGIYLFLAYFLYSKRKAEDTSKPFVFKAFYYITMTAVMFIIIALIVHYDNIEYTLPMLFVSAIVYFICEVIANRGFKRFGYSILRYIATVCGVVVVSLILKNSNGFGMWEKVPSASSIKSVSINYNGVYSKNYSYSCDYFEYEIDTVTITDRESIDAIIAFHEDAIQNHFEGYLASYRNDYYDIYREEDIYDISFYEYLKKIGIYNYNDYYKYVTITYYTKLGRTISRKYRVSFEQYMMLQNLSVDESYMDSVIDGFKESLISYYHDDYYYINIASKLNGNSIEYDNLTYSQIEEFAQCFAEDIRNQTLEDILTPNDVYCYLNNYIIFDSYENTMAYLNECKYRIPSISVYTYDYYSSEDVILYSPDDITCGDGTYYSTIGGYVAKHGTDLNYSQLLQLLQVAQPYYVTTDRCYMLSFFGDMYIIPEEYSDIAESIYKGN